MQIHIYRRKDRGPVWQAQLYVGGKRYRFSCQTDDKETARDGVAAQLVMRYVGHADLTTTLRYTHLVPEQLRAVVERPGNSRSVAR